MAGLIWTGEGSAPDSSLGTQPALPASSIAAGLQAPSAAVPFEQDVARAFSNFGPSQSTVPSGPPPATVAYNPASKEVFVAGYGTFAADDETAAATSFGHVKANTTAPIPAGFTALDSNSYAQHVNEIIDPGIMRLASRGWSSGIDQAKQLGGYGLKFLGAEQTGQGIVDSATKSLNKTSVYSSEFTDTGLAGGEKSVLNWFVYNLAQQGPNLLAFLGASMLGNVAGSAAYGTAAGARAASVAGRIGGLLGKAEYQTAVTSAAQRYAAAQALPAAERAAAMAAIPEEVTLLKEASGMVGAALSSGALNYGMGVSSITQEQEEAGTGRNRLTALTAAVPWAAMESLPEFAGMATLFGKIMTSAPGLKGRAIGAAKAGAVLGGLEGVTNASQDLIQMAVTKPENIATHEGGKRLLNSFVAGAAVGGPLGAAAHAVSPYVPHDLLNRDTINAVNNREANERAARLASSTAEPTYQNLDDAQLSMFGTLPVQMAPPQAGLSNGVTPQGGYAAPTQLDLFRNAEPPTGLPLFDAPQQRQAPSAGAQTPLFDNLPEQRAPVQQAPALSTPQQLNLPLEGQQGELNLGPPVGLPPSVVAANRAAAADAELSAQQISHEAARRAPNPVLSVKLRKAQEQAAARAAVQQAVQQAAEKRAADNAARAYAFQQAEAQRAQQEQAARDAALVPALNQAADIKIATDEQNTPKRDRLRQAERAAARRSKVSGQPVVETPPAEAPQPKKASAASRLAVSKKVVDNSNNVEGASAAAPVAETAVGSNPTATAAPKGEKIKRPRKPAAKAAPEAVVEKVEIPKAAPKPVAAKEAPAPKVDLKKGKAAEAAATEANRDAWVQAEPGNMTEEAAGAQYDALPAERKEQWAKTRANPKAKLDAVRNTIANEVAKSTERTAVAEKLKKGAGKVEARSTESYGAKGDVILAGPAPKPKPSTPKPVQKLKAERLTEATKLANTDVMPDGNVNRFHVGEIDSFNKMTVGEQNAIVQAFGSVGEYAAAIRNAVSTLDRIRFLAAKKKLLADHNHTAEGPGAATLDSWKDAPGFNSLVDDKPIKPMAAGQVRLAVNAFVSKLRVKPKVSVYANQADLKAKNPELYKRAAAARQQGDFDTANAAGYAFGNGNIIVFSDNIYGSQHLRFVLAHEALGHFGLRSILSSSELNSALNQVYNNSEHAQQNVDAAMAYRNISKLEAIEEYLSDYAGSIESSLIKRLSAMIKNALNKLGFKFDDDITRYLMDQSKRYVRFGQPAALTGSFFDPVAMGTRLTNLEQLLDPDGSGRFSTVLNPMQTMIGLQDDGGVKGPAANKFVTAWRSVGINTPDKMKTLFSFLHTLNRIARENPGLAKFYEITSNMHNKLKELRDTFSHMRRLTLQREIKVPGTNYVVRAGLDKKEYAQLNELLMAANIHGHNTVKYADVRRVTGELVTVDALGNPSVNEKVLNQLLDMARIPMADFRDGFDMARFAGVPMTKEEIDAVDAKYDALIAAATTPEAAQKLKKEKADILKTRNRDEVLPMPFKGIPGLTEDSKLWRAYKEHFDNGQQSAMVHAAIQHVIADIGGAKVKQAHMLDKLASEMGRKLKDNEKKFIDNLVERYVRMYALNRDETGGSVEYNTDSMKSANEMAVAFNKVLIGKDTDRIADLTKFFEDKTGDLKATALTKAEVVDAITSLREDSRINAEAVNETRYDAQHLVLNMGLLQQTSENSDMHSKLNIARNYIPVVRRGDHSIRVEAVDSNGKAVKVADEFSQMMGYWQKNDLAAATTAAEDLNRAFKNMPPISMRVMVGNNYEYAPVTFRAVQGTVLKDGTVPSASNLNTVLDAIAAFNINLPPEKRADLVTAITKQSDNSRKSLERRGHPGGDSDMARSASEYLQNVSASIARRIHRPLLDTLFDGSLDSSNKLWFGDFSEKGEYNTLKAAHEANPADKAAAEKFELYHYMTKVNESERTGNTYKSIALENLHFIDSQSNTDTTNFADGTFIKQLRQWTAVAQMGASMATAAIQLIALQTNVIPALATYNQKRSFGGGFGIGRAHVEVYKALKQTTGIGASDSDTFKAMIPKTDTAEAKALRAKWHLTRLEAEFLFKETQSGRMQAAQADAQGANARGDTDSRLQQAFQLMMVPFNIAEQASRRATGLAAFRLEYDKQTRLLLPNDPKYADKMQEAFDTATAFSNKMIDDTLGQYSLGALPRAFQSDVGHLLFMYKVFPVTSAELMRNMDYKGKIMMLGALVILAGMHGIPFADDFIDVLETLSQRILGKPIGSVEAEFYALLEKAVPGLGDFVNHGGIDKIFGISLGQRVANGDILPGTGIFKAGADVGRELEAIAGPVMSFVSQSASTIHGLSRFAHDPTLNKAIDVARESPAAMVRAVSDAAMYYQTGAIVDKRGYVASKDMGSTTIMARLMGFYPSAAKVQNDVIRLNKTSIDYAKEISAAFKTDYIKAVQSGDPEAAQHIKDNVRDWNETAKWLGTGLEIRNFGTNAAQALREARKSTVERSLKSAPISARNKMLEQMSIAGINPRGGSVQ